MSSAEARAKSRTSRRFADRAAFVAVLIGIFSAWGLVTGEQLINPSWGFVGLAASILSGMAYRASRRWHALADQLHKTT